MALGRLINVGSEYVHGVKRSPIKDTYDATGEYLDHRRENVFKFRDANIQDDGRGVPQNNYRWGGPYYYIVTIGHYGLECFSKFKHFENARFLKLAAPIAAWLCDNQSGDGGWDVPYDHNWFPDRVQVLRAPWRSSMGQGLAISFLCRMYSETKDDQYREGALRAINVYQRTPEEGGVLASLDNRCWFEEYPTNPSSFVLNGFMYSLLGLYDASKLLDSKLAAELFHEGIDTLRYALRFFDLGSGTAYDLTHLSAYGRPPNVARWQYHWIHVQLLSVLNYLGECDFEQYVERWDAYLKGGIVKHN